MKTRPLTLPAMSNAQASVRLQLAAGVTQRFCRDQQTGTLSLHLAERVSCEQTSDWRCDRGEFALAEPSPVLSLLADCPLLPFDDADAPSHEWYWTLYNQSLSASLQTWLGEIHPAIAPVAYPDAVTGWLTVAWGGIRARSLMIASATTWLALLAHSGWLCACAAMPSSLVITVPLTLADVALSADTLRRLRAGDLILPSHPYFSPSGQGSLMLPPWRLHGALRLNGLAPYHFTVTDMENIPVNTDFDTSPPADHSDATCDNVTISCADSAPLPPLPIALHIRCGNVSVPLPTLQRLAPGAVLILHRTAPGEAWLYHDATPLAQGELVDVEGRLGLQITRVVAEPDVTTERNAITGADATESAP